MYKCSKIWALAVYVCQMLEDHKWGQQIFHCLLLAVSAIPLLPALIGARSIFLERATGQLLLPCITGIANWDLKSIQDLSCKHLHRYKVVTALKSKSRGREMAYGFCTQKDLEGKETWWLMPSPEFANWDCPHRCCVLRKVLSWSLMTSVEKSPLVIKGFGPDPVYHSYLKKNICSPDKPLGISLLLPFYCNYIELRTDLDRKG